MKLALGLLTGLTTFFAGVILSDVHTIHKVTYRMRSRKIKKNIKIAVLADLHGTSFGKGNEKLIRMIDAEKPDIVIMAGDMISAKLKLDIEAAIDLTSKLSHKYPVYYGMGNHENFIGEHPEAFDYSLKKLEAQLKKAGAKILKNKSTYFEEYGITITGLNLPRRYFKKFGKEAFTVKGIGEWLEDKDDSFEILIGHNPEYFDQYVKRGSQLTFAGHLHGGIMRLPKGRGFISPRFRLFPKYAGGLFKKDGCKMIVSRGLGTHTIPVRVFNPGELVITQLEKY